MGQAGQALRLSGQAYCATVRLNQMAEPDLHRIGHYWIQVVLDLVRIRLITETQALGKATHVGIDADGGLAKDVTPEDIGGLPSHTWQGDKILQLPWDLSPELGYDLSTTLLNSLGFVPIKTGGADLCLQRGAVCGSPVARNPIFLEEICRDLVHSLIGALGGQDQGDEKLGRSGEVQSKPDTRIGPIQNLHDLLDPRPFFLRCFRHSSSSDSLRIFCRTSSPARGDSPFRYNITPPVAGRGSRGPCAARSGVAFVVG